MNVYTLRDCDSGVEEEIEAINMQAACLEARDWISQGDYNDIESTIWVDCWVIPDGDELEERITVAIDPEEPSCTDTTGHDWQSPYDWVGGIKENPGCWGHGGGCRYIEVCIECGCGRHTDTWAQRSDTGEQGLTSVHYVEGEFEEQVEAQKEEQRQEELIEHYSDVVIVLGKNETRVKALRDADEAPSNWEFARDRGVVQGDNELVEGAWCCVVRAADVTDTELDADEAVITYEHVPEDSNALSKWRKSL